MGAIRRRPLCDTTRPASAPVVTGLLLAAMFFTYAFELSGDGQAICQAHGFVPARPTAGSALSYAFLHDPGSWLHIGGNAIFLAFFGTLVERVLGAITFALLYLVSGVGAAAMHAMVDPTSATPLVGASGALLGVMAAAAVIAPRMVGFVGAYAAYNIVSLFVGAGDSVSVACHVGGFSAGAAFVLLRLCFARAAVTF